MATRITLARTPHGPLTDDVFATEEVSLPALQDGEFLVAVTYLSIDPTIRGWIARETYLPKVQEGDVIRSLGAGEVIDSRNPKYPVGTHVSGLTGWQSHVILTGAGRIPEGVSDVDALSVLGMTGLTAYVGVMDIGQPQPGETFVVSGAAGAVGSIAGQLAKHQGARVVGIAGSEEKCRWVVDELGLDECINYHTEKVSRRLRETCPKGIDVYFDNVGGETLNTVLAQIRNHARIVLCGSISGYDSTTLPPGPANLVNAIPRRALLQGFIVLDHYDRMPEATEVMGAMLREGALKSRVDVVSGLTNAPAALARLFEGGNIGKSLVSVA